MRITNGDRISSYIAAIMRDIFPKYEYHGIYRYQVFRQTGEKLELQILKKKPGLPDILPVEMFPGVAGAFSTVSESSTALVMFIDGDPSQPIVVGFAPKSEGDLHYPEATVLNAITSIDIGKDNLEHVVKWPGFSIWASQVIVAFNGIKADITAGLALAQPKSGPSGVPYTPVTPTPDDPPGFTESTKVRVE